MAVGQVTSYRGDSVAIGIIGLSDQLQALRLFVQVARTGSFSKGARAMKLSQPTASRIIALLEDSLARRCFSRSTRALTLTDSGSSYLARVRPILDSLGEADNSVRGGDKLQRHAAGRCQLDPGIANYRAAPWCVCRQSSGSAGRTINR